MTDVALATKPPSSKEEDWRYTPIKEISSRISISESANRSLTQDLSTFDINTLASDLGGPRLVFINGFYNQDLSRVKDLPSGLFCGLASENKTIDKELVGKTENVRTIEGLQDSSSDHDVAYVMAQDNITFDQPINIIHVSLSADEKVVSHPRTIVQLGENAKLTLVETFCGTGDNSVIESSTSIQLADNAILDQCRIQNEHPDAIHVGHTQTEQGSNSKVNLSSVTLGADIARNAIDVSLNSPDAQIDLSGINITNRNQVHDTVLTVDHRASHCASNQRFVGVVNDHGHGSFGGEIIVQKGTVGTDAHQNNRNLVLDVNAKADTRPWLRIFADDVKCTHGATVGRLDDDSLFYLRSRGIELEQAKTMLIDAFISDITNTIANETIREAVTSLISETNSTKENK